MPRNDQRNGPRTTQTGRSYLPDPPRAAHPHGLQPAPRPRASDTLASGCLFVGSMIVLVPVGVMFLIMLWPAQ